MRRTASLCAAYETRRDHRDARTTPCDIKHGNDETRFDLLILSLSLSLSRCRHVVVPVAFRPKRNDAEKAETPERSNRCRSGYFLYWRLWPVAQGANCGSGTLPSSRHGRIGRDRRKRQPVTARNRWTTAPPSPLALGERRSTLGLEGGRNSIIGAGPS